MIIRRLAFSGYRGFTFNLKFEADQNVMVGMNGCGKTTVLELIAGMAGTDAATELVAGKAVKYAYIEVVENKQVHKLYLEGSFDAEKIADFKAKLSKRVSYILRHELYDNRYVGEVRPRQEAIDHMLRYLEVWDLGLARQFRYTPNAMTLLVGATGAQPYLMTVAMRLPPEDVPILVDMPERSLHVIVSRSVHEFYRWGDQQLICATHSPEVLAGFERMRWKYNDFGGVDDKYRGLFSMDNDKLRRPLQFDAKGNAR